MLGTLIVTTFKGILMRETVMRAASVILLTLISTGCAYVPTDTFVEALRLQLTARDGGAVITRTFTPPRPSSQCSSAPSGISLPGTRTNVIAWSLSPAAWP